MLGGVGIGWRWLSLGLIATAVDAFVGVEDRAGWMSNNKRVVSESWINVSKTDARFDGTDPPSCRFRAGQEPHEAKSGDGDEQGGKACKNRQCDKGQHQQ